MGCPKTHPEYASEGEPKTPLPAFVPLSNSVMFPVRPTQRDYLARLPTEHGRIKDGFAGSSTYMVPVEPGPGCRRGYVATVKPNGICLFWVFVFPQVFSQTLFRNQGLVVDGFKKFVGMGLVQRSMQEMLSGKKATSCQMSAVQSFHNCIALDFIDIASLMIIATFQYFWYLCELV